VATDEPLMASVAGRYARALFDLAKDEDKLKEVESDIVTIQQMLDESEDLRRMVRSPLISSDDQIRVLTVILDRAGISALTANFFKLVARNRRLFAAADMIKAFRALLARERGEVAADVTSAHALNNEQLNMLSEALSGVVGQAVKVNTKVQPNLLGGLIVKIGSRMFDSSLRTKLINLKIALKGNS
jgi:F-type H+-transporting ATPase subunit delta